MIAVHKYRRFFEVRGARIVLIIFLAVFILRGGQGDSTLAAEFVEEEEYSVWAAVVNQIHLPKSPRWFMLADRTVSFQCDPSASLGIDVGGCGGMRVQGQTSAEVFERVRQQITAVTATLTSDLEKKSRQSATIDRTLPLPVRQVIWGPGFHSQVPKDLGAPDFAVYPSRVGFNDARNQAFLYMGVISWTDPSRSFGEYVYIEKTSGAWMVKGRVRVWELLPAR